MKNEIKVANLVDVIKLKEKTYAVISPNKIIFLSDATFTDVGGKVEEERKLLSKLIIPTFKKEVEAITFIPTMNCNLKCIYCYAKGGEEQMNLSEDIARVALDDFARRIKSKEVQIDFAGGGEPFLNFKVMKYIVSHAKKLFKTVHIRLVTNGTFNEEQLRWIIDSDVDLRVSFDGLAHEFQRPFKSGLSSKEVVENNIKQLVKLNKKFKIQCVVTARSVSKLVDTVKYLYKLGAKTVKVEPVHISDISRKTKQLRAPTPACFVNAFIKALNYIAKNDLGMKIDTAFLSRPTIGYYCGLRHNIIITPEGYISGCVEFTRKTDPFSDLILNGKCSLKEKKLVFNEQAKFKLKKLHFSNYEICSKCNLKLICKSGCPARNLFDKGYTFIPSSYTCEIERKLIPKVLYLISRYNKYSDIVFDKFEEDEC